MDHLTHDACHLHSRESYTGHDQVRTADGYFPEKKTQVYDASHGLVSPNSTQGG